MVHSVASIVPASQPSDEPLRSKTIQRMQSKMIQRVDTNPKEAHCRHFKVEIEGRLVMARRREKTK